MAHRSPDVASARPVAPDAPLLAPRQARSRRTADRLLDAAEWALAEHGLDGATVPTIAARAGLSVGVVYRRFRDKDALLRAVYERFFARAVEGNRAALAPERWTGAGAAAVVAAVVAGMVRGHVAHGGLLRALFAYAASHADPEFRRRVAELNAAATGQVTTLLAERTAELSHPDPARAVDLALAVVAAALHRWIQADAPGAFGDGFPADMDADRLAAELTRMVVGYLGIAPPS
jgi:AcrR family transcriptional regulator